MTLAICLLLLAFALVLAEIAIPSFGLLSLLAAGAFAFALVEAFAVGRTQGWTFVTLGVVLTPVAVALGLRVLPRTPVGRRLMLQAPAADSARPSASEANPLEGRDGEALTDLRPSGVARIDGRRLDVTAAGRYLSRGSRVRVLRVQGNRIVVEEAPPSSNNPDLTP